MNRAHHDKRQQRLRELYGEDCDLFLPDATCNIDLGESLVPGLECLRTVERFLAIDTDGRVSIAERLINLFSGNVEPRMPYTAFRGLRPVVEALTGRMWRVNSPVLRDDWRTPWPIQVDWSLNSRNPSWIRFLCDQQLGILRYGPGIRPADLIAEAVDLCRTASIVVFCRIESAATTMCRRLTEILPESSIGLALCDRVRRPSARVVVGTLGGLIEHRIFAEYRHAILVPDATDLVHDQQTILLTGASHPRLIGLLPCTEQLAPLDKDHLRCIFGFDELHIPAQGQERVLPSVAFIRMHGGLSGRTPTELRSCIWRNPIRNKRIACVIKSLQAADRSRLSRDFSEAARAWRSDAPPRSMVVLVENAEHGGHLLRRLDESFEFAASEFDLGSLDRIARQEIERRRRRVQPLRPTVAVVATAEGFRQMDLSSIDVIVRADAGAGMLPIDPWQLSQPQGGDRQILVIDTDDRHGPIMRRRTRQRRLAYSAADWFDSGISPAHGRVLRFIRQRPK